MLPHVWQRPRPTQCVYFSFSLVFDLPTRMATKNELYMLQHCQQNTKQTNRKNNACVAHQSACSKFSVFIRGAITLYPHTHDRPESEHCHCNLRRLIVPGDKLNRMRSGVAFAFAIPTNRHTLTHAQCADLSARECRTLAARGVPGLLVAKRSAVAKCCIISITI